ncbi:hypothetical protein ABH926_004382 [Catenulispora sp. GP43]|uniref:gas vesicle protein GvpG n=1 Tax=Catenulispora sp. GP43 TaxID=3156263 RepID=UPI0035156F90
MGLFTGLLTFPLAPVRGVVWVAEQISEQARRELEDPTAIRRQLTEVEAARVSGALTDQEADEQEAELVRRLWEVRQAGAGRKV